VNASDLLTLIRRDIRMVIQQSLSYKGGHDFAQNLRASTEVAKEVEGWIDQMIEANLDKPKQEAAPAAVPATFSTEDELIEWVKSL
jgi:hypothetical protein